MRRVLRLLLPFKKAIALGVLTLMVVDAAQLVIPLIIRRAIDELVLREEVQPRIRFYALLILGLAGVIATFRFLWRYLIIGSARKAERNLRNRLYQHFLTLDTPFYHRHRTGDLMAHTTNDIDAVRMACAFGVVGFMDILVYSIFAISAMVYIAPKLTLIALIPLPVITVLVWGGGRLIHRRFRQVQEAFSALTEAVREAIAGIRVLKVFNAYPGELRHLRDQSWAYVRQNLDLVKITGLLFPAVTFIGGLATAIVLYAGGSRVILGEISLGDFVAFTTYLGMLIWPMMAIGWVVNVFQRGAASMERIENLLSQKPIIVDGPVEAEIHGKIEIRGLTFAYQDKPVLEDVSLSAEPGQRIGIVGLIGSGKSTLVKMIPRILDPPKGTVFVDDREIHEYKLKALRRAVGYVPQEPLLFSATIRENLCLGIPDDELPEDEVLWDVLEKVEIADEIASFPEGLDTLVGERGVMLSGGQRQRISLARALLTHPKILILDDAFSAVDTSTEQRIIRNLEDFLRARTTIIVTHRLSSVLTADRIYVFDAGRIIEEGTHEELVARQGFYAQIYALQKMMEVDHVPGQRGS